MDIDNFVCFTCITCKQYLIFKTGPDIRRLDYSVVENFGATEELRSCEKLINRKNNCDDYNLDDDEDDDDCNLYGGGAIHQTRRRVFANQ